MEKFQLILGGENCILQGGLWTSYMVDVAENEMICTGKNTQSAVTIPYTAFKSAEFGIGNGNLWLQCKVSPIGSDEDICDFVFCSPRKYWKSVQGKKLIEKINAQTEIKDIKEYKAFTGPFFFLAMFK